MMDFNRCTVALLDETETTYRLLTLLETRPEMFRTSEDHFSLDRGISAKASRRILGSAILGVSGDEAVHNLLDVMYSRKP